MGYSLFSLTSFALSALCLWLALPLQLNRKLFLRQGVAQSGGLAVSLALFFTCFALAPAISREAAGFFVASSIILLMGLVDDLHELSVKAKLLLQLSAAMLVISSGLHTKIVYIGAAANALITLVWIVGITNSFNLLDIVDGLCGGAALIICSALSVVSVLSGQPELARLVAFSLAGAVAGFLVFNLPPARVYLGNSGSHFVGFLIACLAIMIDYASLNRSLSLLAPVFILGFPLFDTFFVMWMRIWRNKLPFHKTNDHLVLRLRSLGYPPRRVLAMLLLICLLFSAGGVVISQMPNSVNIIIIAVLFFLAFLLSRKAAAAIIND